MNVAYRFLRVFMGMAVLAMLAAGTAGCGGGGGKDDVVDLAADESDVADAADETAAEMPPADTPQETAPGDEGPGDAAEADASPYEDGATAVVISSASQLMQGPIATGTVGDILLKNRYVRFIVRTQPLGLYNPFGGDLVDADIVREAGDEGHEQYLDGRTGPGAFRPGPGPRLPSGPGSSRLPGSRYHRAARLGGRHMPGAGRLGRRCSGTLVVPQGLTFPARLGSRPWRRTGRLPGAAAGA